MNCRRRKVAIIQLIHLASADRPSARTALSQREFPQRRPSAGSLVDRWSAEPDHSSDPCASGLLYLKRTDVDRRWGLGGAALPTPPRAHDQTTDGSSENVTTGKVMISS